MEHPRRRAAAVAFLLAIAVVPLVDGASGVWPGRGVHGQSVRTGSFTRAVEASLSRSSRVAAYLRPRYGEALYVTLGAARPMVLVGANGWLFLSPSRATEREAQATVASVAASVAAMTEWLEARGSRVILVVVPDKSTFYRDRLPTKQRGAETYAPLLAALRARGLPVLDLRDTLATVPLAYTPNDSHWSSEGAWACAAAVARLIRECFGKEELPGEPLDARLRSRWRPERGDLPRFLDIRPDGVLSWMIYRNVRQLLPVERATKRRVRAAAASPYLVAGTSFSETRDFPALLATALRRRVAARLRKGIGPGASILSVADDISSGRLDPPEVIVWEAPERHWTDERLYGRIGEMLRTGRLPHMEGDPSRVGD